VLTQDRTRRLPLAFQQGSCQCPEAMSMMRDAGFRY
jgi:hypothetical protein